MKYDHTGTALPSRKSSYPDNFPRRSIRLLVRGPAEVKSRAARWVANLMAVAGAVLLVWSGVIHLQLWSDGYRSISVVGPLFLAQGVGSIVVALALGVLRRLVLMAAGAVTLAATAIGLLLSASIGLFGYRESLAVPYAGTSLIVEFAGAAVLVAAAVIILAARSLPGTPGQSIDLRGRRRVRRGDLRGRSRVRQGNL